MRPFVTWILVLAMTLGQGGAMAWGTARATKTEVVTCPCCGEGPCECGMQDDEGCPCVPRQGTRVRVDDQAAVVVVGRGGERKENRKQQPYTEVAEKNRGTQRKSWGEERMPRRVMGVMGPVRARLGVWVV